MLPGVRRKIKMKTILEQAFSEAVYFFSWQQCGL